MKYEYSIGYEILRFFERITLNLHYRKIVYVGVENIDESKPVIFASNHRNAAIDPLLLLNVCKKQPVFLARADIFKKPAIARILTWLHIMPVYRMRDGLGNLQNNNQSFELSGELLRKKIPMAIYPEGTHNPKMYLLPVQKAISRIVLPIEAGENFSLGTEIIPVGVYYTDIFGFLSDAYMVFGKPLKVAEFKEQYQENPNQTANILRRDLEIEMRKLIVDIRNHEFYDEYVWAVDWNAFWLSKTKFAHKKEGYLLAAQEVVKILDELHQQDRTKFDTKIENFREAYAMLKAHGISTKDNINRPKSIPYIALELMFLIILSPVALFGLINGIFPILGYRKALTLFKDKQFIPTVRVVCGLFLVPIFTVIQSLLLGFIFNWCLASVYFFLMPTAFYFACRWRKWAKTLARKWQVNRFIKNYPHIWAKVKTLIQI